MEITQREANPYPSKTILNAGRVEEEGFLFNRIVLEREGNLNFDLGTVVAKKTIYEVRASTILVVLGILDPEQNERCTVISKMVLNLVRNRGIEN